MTYDYDLIIIGSGPAGRRAAIQAAKVGRRVLVVERGRRVGGVSVHTGTIPSKTLRETVMNLSGWRERGFYGRSYRVKQEIRAADLRQRLVLTLDHEVEVLEHQFARNRVATCKGSARFLSPHEIEVTGDDGRRNFTAANFLVAVGTNPYRPQHIPFDGRCVLDSDEILDIVDVPRSLTVIGAGVIGIEYATIFSALDVHVTLIDPEQDILKFIDREIVGEFLHDLRDRGIALRLGCQVDDVDVGADGCRVAMSDGREVRCDMVLFAAGRAGATGALGLEAAMPFGREGDDQLRRRAVRIGDDVLAVVLGHVLGEHVTVGLRHDERHVDVVAEGRRIIDHQAAGRADLRRPLLGDAAAGAHQREIAFREVELLEVVAFERFLAEADFAAERTA